MADLAMSILYEDIPLATLNQRLSYLDILHDLNGWGF